MWASVIPICRASVTGLWLHIALEHEWAWRPRILIYFLQQNREAAPTPCSGWGGDLLGQHVISFPEVASVWIPGILSVHGEEAHLQMCWSVLVWAGVSLGMGQEEKALSSILLPLLSGGVKTEVRTSQESEWSQKQGWCRPAMMQTPCADTSCWL